MQSSRMWLVICCVVLGYTICGAFLTNAFVRSTNIISQPRGCRNGLCLLSARGRASKEKGNFLIPIQVKGRKGSKAAESLGSDLSRVANPESEGREEEVAGAAEGGAIRKSQRKARKSVRRPTRPIPVSGSTDEAIEEQGNPVFTVETAGRSALREGTKRSQTDRLSDRCGLDATSVLQSTEGNAGSSGDPFGGESDHGSRSSRVWHSQGPEFSALEDPRADLWKCSVYEGGRPLPRAGMPETGIDGAGEGECEDEEEEDQERFYWEQVDEALYGHDRPSPWRAQVVAVVTNSSRNNTALDCVERIFEHLRRGTNDDPRLAYHTICLVDDDDQALPELEGSVQMWVEGYNTYHLVDGAAMKEAYGGVVPEILLSERNLQALLEQVRWALEEDTLGGTMLTPRMRRLRLRGGAQEMIMGFNTDKLDSKFSVVNVR